MMDAEIAALLARPPGPHEPEGDPGMLDVSRFPARCTRCSYVGAPTYLQRCQAAPEVDALLEEFGIDGERLVWCQPPVYRPRRVMRGRSGAAWLKGDRKAATPGRNGVTAGRAGSSRSVMGER